MKLWLEKNVIGIYSAYREGKSFIAERFIRTLKNKIDKYMTSISKNVYIDRLKDIVNKYGNTCHRNIEMKPVDVKLRIYIEFNKENNKGGPKFKVADHVRILKYKNLVAKGYVRNWAEEVLVINKVKNTVPWTYVIIDFNGEEIVGTFYEDKLKEVLS